MSHLDKLRMFVPYGPKAVRQQIRLQRAGRISGLSTRLPMPQKEDLDSPIYILGSGASALDIDVHSEEFRKCISVTLNNAIFLHSSPNFHSFEKTFNSERATKLIYSEEVLLEILRDSSVDVLCQVPMRLRTLVTYPEAILLRPDNSHLFVSVDALPSEKLDEQMRHYLSENIGNNLPGPDPGYSLGRILVRLVKMGFKDIRLIGIDLFNAEHFWHHSDEHSWINSFYPVERNQVHGTNREDRIWPAHKFLSRLHQMEDDYGYRLRTDKNSGSSKILPSWN